MPFAALRRRSQAQQLGMNGDGFAKPANQDLMTPIVDLIFQRKAMVVADEIQQFSGTRESPRCQMGIDRKARARITDRP